MAFERTDRYFPEIIDESSSHQSLSPLTAIIEDLRRKNVVTAAAASGHQISLLDSSDPWGSSEGGGSGGSGCIGGGGGEEDNLQSSRGVPSNGVFCTCTSNSKSLQRRSITFTQRRRSSFSGGNRSSSFDMGRRQSIGYESSVTNEYCPSCNLPRKSLDSSGRDMPSRNLTRRVRLSSWLNRTRTERLEAPQHALSLLQSTPHLRVISQASMDMQGAGTTTSGGFFGLIFPLSLDKTNVVSHHLQNESNNNNGSTRVNSSSDYNACLVRDSANQQAATELASLLWILAHEMSLEDYGTVESEVFTSVFALVHSSENHKRMAGLAALDALIDAPSADEEKKAIKFANTLSNGLRSAHGDYEFLSAVSKALGHMAMRTANVDFVESEVTRALEWLRTDRSDRRLAASLALKEFAIHAPTAFYSKTSQSTLGQGGSNEFLDHIFKAVSDPQPIVRACATDALSQCLNILMERQHMSLTGLLCQVYFSVIEGLDQVPQNNNWNAINKAEATCHGSLLVVATMIAHTRDFMLPRYDEICTKIMNFLVHPKALIRLEVIRILPRLARRCPRVFARRYLEASLDFLIQCAASPVQPRVGVDLRPSAFTAIGLLVLAMVDEDTGDIIGASLPTVKIMADPENPEECHMIELAERGIIIEKLGTIFELITRALKTTIVTGRKSTPDMHISVFHCAADLVEALGTLVGPYITDLIQGMFRAGLSNDLIQCLHSIAESLPTQQSSIEDRLLQEVSLCLAGVPSARAICDPLTTGPKFSASFSYTTRPRLRDDDSGSGGVGAGAGAGGIAGAGAGAGGGGGGVGGGADNTTRRDAIQRKQSVVDSGTERTEVTINMSDDPPVVRDLVLSLQTLGSFGDAMGRVTTSGAVVPLLPFVKDVASQYLYHPSSEVRREAVLTCCTLLVPPGIVHKNRVGSYSGRIIEDVLAVLLRVAVSDPSPVVRLCVVRALDSRYDPFLCQAHMLQSLFLLLQDEVLTTRVAGMRLLGRLATINPAPILPYMRKLLVDLIIELQCGVDTGRGREEATRLLVVFLRSKSLQRLIHPVLPSLVRSLPLNGATPRLASAALEALGELAKAAGSSLQPWVKAVVPNILDTLQDQSSASKQRTSLKTLAQIAGSTGYVILPYLDNPRLLSQATDILPGTKRAPWALRREVIRTLGVLGALDPDRYHTVAPKTRKGGAVGGAYFVEQDDIEKARNNATEVSWDTSEKVSEGAKDAKIVTKYNGFKEAIYNTQDSDDDLPAHLFMYEQYAMVAQPVSSLPPARRMTPGDEEFYPTVAIQALMRIFKDPSLAVHHGMVMQAIMFIFKSLGLRCVPFLSKVVPHIMLTIRTCGPNNLRESLLKQVATLSGIVREHLRPYVADIFDVVEQFWPSRHLGTIFSLVSHIAVGVPDDFKKFVPRLIRRVLTSLDEIQVADWMTTNKPSGPRGHGSRGTERLRLILRSVRGLRGVMSDYLHVLVPALLKLCDSLVSLSDTEGSGSVVLDGEMSNLTLLALQTTSALLECEGMGGATRVLTPYWGDRSDASIRSGSLSARAVQPLVRLLGERCRSNKRVGLAIVDTLCVCAKQLGSSTWMKLYHNVVRNSISAWQKRIEGGNENPSNGGNDAHILAIDDHHLTSLEMYDDIVRDLQASPYQRSYINPNPVDGWHAATRQDSMLPFSADPLHQQGGFVDNPITAGGFDTNNDLDNPAPPPFHQANTSSKQKLNQHHLQRAWDVSQCASREDWDEWMRRLGIELLKEAPSPALRATASLAHAYQPLARELFSAAFVCCWKELSKPYRVNLVHSLETAFDADVSPEILQTLLNLAEFMEHDPSGGLPIDIPILAELALKCRAYAKALHYKEREHRMGGANSCVEALISINRKLDLQEAALGVLKSATMRLGDRRIGSSGSSVGPHLSAQFARHHQAHEMYYSVVWSTEDETINRGGPLDLAENKELWLAKLGSWTEALEVYEERLVRNPRDFDAILGCMRCFDASAEWERVLELAENNWPTLSGASGYMYNQMDGSPATNSSLFIPTHDQKKALRMCAQAAWRLGQWDDLEKFSSELVHGHNPQQSSHATASGTTGVFRDGFVPRIDFHGAFFSAVLHIHRKEWSLAAEAIDAARKAMDSRFTALMAESYNRAYPSMVTAQILAEMEEIIEYRKLEKDLNSDRQRYTMSSPQEEHARERLLSVWRKRLAGCRVDAEVHSSILAVRSLVLGPTDEVQSILTLSELSREAQRFKLAEQVLLEPLFALGADLNGPTFGFGLDTSLGLRWGLEKALSTTSMNNVIDSLVNGDASAILPKYSTVHHHWSKQLIRKNMGLDRVRIQHQLYFAYLKHLWLTDRREEALHRLDRLSDVVDLISHCEGATDNSLRVGCWVELGEWKMEEITKRGSYITEPQQVDVLSVFKRAILVDRCGYKAWHAWALLNFKIALQLTERDEGGATSNSRRRAAPSSTTQQNHVITAIKGFTSAMSLGTKRWSASVQQDMLNLLTCLFKYGEQPEIASYMNECVGAVAIEAWLGVLPQLLARIHIQNSSIRSVLHPLLVHLGERHPQALMYPLSVLLKSPVAERKSAAESLMNSLKGHSSALVEEALMVSSELIRVAILWLETWHEGLEDASRLYFGEGNVSGMLDLLLPLHEKLEMGAETRRENDFIKNFGQDLAQAHMHLREYVRLVTEGGSRVPTGPRQMTGYDGPVHHHVRQNEEAETAMNKAWDFYYTVFRRINKQLPALTKLELTHCSPALSRARSLELGVPGSYRVDGSYVKIERFVPSVQVITSKQRPRKITLCGSDGKDYVFLLKGHEDLRQDERVMQLFGLVNALLERDRQTKKHDLRIQRYAISPLSHNCGLVGWVPHTDTLHSLIRDYRLSKKIYLNMENREMADIAPNYDMLTVMQKVEVFTDALRRTTGKGNDLYEILWLKSTNSEEWLERRTKYTRSLAVMSMVGYILGLGDRHPSNLMLDKLSGRVLHIDFGDCFEVAMNRDKYPEKVPFRLTRMLVKAMEVSGIEGSYRSTCERTMTVLRESRDSLVAMLEAFVYDPLISWRLVDLSGKEANNMNEELSGSAITDLNATAAAAAATTTTTTTMPNNNDNNINNNDNHNNHHVNHANAMPPMMGNEANDALLAGAPIDLTGRSSILHAPITEGPNEDGGDDDDGGGNSATATMAAGMLFPNNNEVLASSARPAPRETMMNTTRARSFQMYSNIQTWAANLSSDARIASISVRDGSDQVVSEGSIARSRMARSMRQRELLSLLEGEEGAAHEEALNEKALKVIRRVQDKLTGTDFMDHDDRDPLDVMDQVQRLIVQATSVENLCQLFIGWCAFW